MKTKKSTYFDTNPVDPKASNLLPVRPRPFPGELLNSWLIRLATENGVSNGCFARQVLDVDRLSLIGAIDTDEIPGLLSRLTSLTGVPVKEIIKLAFYDSRWTIPGIVPIRGIPKIAKMSFETKRSNQEGLRICGYFRACIPCWQEDPIPFIRRIWRQRFTTTCAKHSVILINQCNRCGNRLDSSFRHGISLKKHFFESIAICRHCGADFRDQPHPAIDDFYVLHSTWVGNDKLENWIAVEKVYQRSFERGWFTLEDSAKLLSEKAPRRCPWSPCSPSLGMAPYPKIERRNFPREFGTDLPSSVKVLLGIAANNSDIPPQANENRRAV